MMNNETDELDLDGIKNRVMAGLKDFQKATVERVDWLYRHNQKRVLVADEVGLGKTLIARGVVAMMAKFRKEKDDPLFKVVYVCSNAAIADQNLRKLQITHNAQLKNSSYDRLSMQHLNIAFEEHNDELLKKYVQLIALTPDTSFKINTGAGTAAERALMFMHLCRLAELHRYLPQLEVILKGRGGCSWKRCLDDCNNKFEQLRELEQQANTLKHRADNCNDYFESMERQLLTELGRCGEGGLMDSIIAKCRKIRRDSNIWDGDIGIIGRLRMVFAKISLERLEPDLVIMDEFQRFKELLNADKESEIGMLTDKFFHAHNDMRMLLLSATPYKMYSTLEEIDDTRVDEHYDEFLRVMKFLKMSDGEAFDEEFGRFKTVWENYSTRLQELKSGGMTMLLLAKQEAENAMYQMMCRTERIAVKNNADLIDDTSVRDPLGIQEADVISYVQGQELLSAIAPKKRKTSRCANSQTSTNANRNGLLRMPTDYVKSAPYLLSFMRGNNSVEQSNYQLAREVKRYFGTHQDEIKKADKPTLWLNPKRIRRYDKIPNNNARLERVMEQVLRSGTERMLWLPPSLPYYELQGVFKDAQYSTKTLVFSSWEMVPRMLASLLSYEAERRTVGELAKKDNDIKDKPDLYGLHSNPVIDNESPQRQAKRYPAARMHLTLSNGEPTAMNLFCLLYPSHFLADCYAPLACLNAKMAIREIQQQIGEQIKRKLARLSIPEKRSRVDGSWYYLAPMMLDKYDDVDNWLKGLRDNINKDKTTMGKRQKLAYLDALLARFNEASRRKFANLGRQPDDLIETLTDMAIASPAICALRTYQKYLGVGGQEQSVASLSSQLAFAFVNRMNGPVATAVIELACDRKANHWRNFLTYCRQGNLQAVFDEYAHMLANDIGQGEQQLEDLHKEMTAGMHIRVTSYSVDTFNSFRATVKKENKSPVNIRTHFAVAFARGAGGESESDVNRKKTMRCAFNSPFWPFVLATTSIGQEGLDFHNYCRRIVHWNLPANPIDLEQREGRINRFKCHAIRQNIAKRYGGIQFANDAWQEMFNEAFRIEKAEGASDLIPFWALAKKDGEDLIKIERIVPMYPFSLDQQVYKRLINILSLYRLTLGQPRQEELLDYLQRQYTQEELNQLLINLSPFSKNQPHGDGNAGAPPLQGEVLI